MSLQSVLSLIEQYGLLIVFLVVFLEYMNMPGFPAGVILPFAGAWAAKGHGFLITLLITIAAGLSGSVILYYVGKIGGTKLIEKCANKSPKLKKKLDNLTEMITQKGGYAVFLAKLIPVVRTLVGIPAGALGMKLPAYLVASVLGIAVWNSVLFCAGYFLAL
ncbi:MAG: DedA family protein [Lachnospiraceae bacterium]|nr:DedA family protein [Lachnospiraceae bacterium]